MDYLNSEIEQLREDIKTPGWTNWVIIAAMILSIAGALSACSATPAPSPTAILSPTPAPIPTAILSPTYTSIPTVTMEPTKTLESVSKVLWPTTTEEGNQIIQKILSALSAAGIQTVDVASFTDASDPNSLLGRPHQYIAKVVWRDPSIAAEGEASVDNGGTIEVFLTSSDLQARYDYIDAITSSTPMLVEYHYQNAPAFIRLSKAYLPSQAQKIADIFLPLVFKNYTAPLWRFGVSLTRRGLTDYDSYGLASMRFGWYVDYSVTANPPTPYGMEYVPIVRIKQLKLAGDGSTTECSVAGNYVTPYTYTVSPSVSQIQSIASSHPGMTWVIGNEMDRVDYENSDGSCGRQDEMLPELYAQAYHDLYSAIKSADPTAQVAIGGMVEFTDLRRQYLDRIWAEYSRLYDGQTMPVDIWNIHSYVLQEVKNSWGAGIPAGFSETSGTLYTILDNKDFTKVWAQIVSIRTWMKDHGQQNKPLITTEYGVLWPAWLECPAYPDTSGCPFTPEQVRDSFMYPSFDSFLNQTDANIGYPADGNRLIQRWNWFSVDYDVGKCDSFGSEVLFTEYLAGSLFNSGLEPSNPPTNCSFPAQGIAPLGTYWQQYVQSLPAGSTKPYAP